MPGVKIVAMNKKKYCASQVERTPIYIKNTNAELFHFSSCHPPIQIDKSKFYLVTQKLRQSRYFKLERFKSNSELLLLFKICSVANQWHQISGFLFQSSICRFEHLLPWSRIIGRWDSQILSDDIIKVSSWILVLKPKIFFLPKR